MIVNTDIEESKKGNINLEPTLCWRSSNSPSASSQPPPLYQYDEENPSTNLQQNQEDQSSSIIQQPPDHSQTIEIPDFHSLPSSAFLGQQPHSEVPIFHFHNQPWYIPPHQPYSDPQPYPSYQPFPEPYPDEKHAIKIL